MPNPKLRRAYFQGLRDGLPFLLVVVPFGVLFGVLASEAGWSLFATMAMSVMVVAGASQFTALQLMSENAPTLVVVGAALAVNLRLAMYSASMAPHLGAIPIRQRALAVYFLVDQTYAAAINRYALQPRMGPAEKLAHFFGAATPVCLPWYFATWAGAVAGAAIPPELALDFAVPITFIAIVAPSLTSLPHLAAAAVSVIVALALAWMPFNLWLLVAALPAMATGAVVEAWQERRR
jgi:predicted branched-subunit amino acid permease